MAKKPIKVNTALRDKMRDHMHDVRKKLGAIDYHLEKIKKDMKEEDMEKHHLRNKLDEVSNAKLRSYIPKAVDSAKEDSDKAEKRSAGIRKASKKLAGVKEETDLTEISSKKLTAYADSAEKDMHKAIADKDDKRASKRVFGTVRAEKKLSRKDIGTPKGAKVAATEETEIEEGKTYRNDDLGSKKSNNLTRALKKSSKLQKKAAASKRHIEEDAVDETKTYMSHFSTKYYPANSPEKYGFKFEVGGIPKSGSVGTKRAANVPKRVKAVKEETIDELSKKTLGSYVKQSSLDIDDRAFHHGGNFSRKDAAKDPVARAEHGAAEHALTKRKNGIAKAVNKIVKEASTKFGDGYGNPAPKDPKTDVNWVGTPPKITPEVKDLPKEKIKSRRNPYGRNTLSYTNDLLRRLGEDAVDEGKTFRLDKDDAKAATMIKSKQYRDALRKASAQDRTVALTKRVANDTTGGNDSEYA